MLLSDGAQWDVRFPAETPLPTFNVLCHLIFYPRSCYFWIPGFLACPCWKNNAVAFTSLKLVLLSTFWNRFCRYLTLREPTQPSKFSSNAYRQYVNSCIINCLWWSSFVKSLWMKTSAEWLNVNLGVKSCHLIPVWVALLVLTGLNWSPDLVKLISKTEYLKLFKKNLRDHLIILHSYKYRIFVN